MKTARYLAYTAIVSGPNEAIGALGDPTLELKHGDVALVAFNDNGRANQPGPDHSDGAEGPRTIWYRRLCKRASPETLPPLSNLGRVKKWKLTLLLGLGFVCSTAFAVEITDLGTLGGDKSGAVAINDSDQTIGWSWITGNEESHSFLYSNGEMTDLYPFRYAENINNVGQIAGVAESNGIFYPARYDSQTGNTVTLGSLGGVTAEGFAGLALGINGLGQVVGYAFLPDNSSYHAFLSDSSGIHDLGCANAPCISAASDINDQGQIVGTGQTSDGNFTYAFLYENGAMTAKAPFGSSSSTASAVNNNSQFVGYYAVNGHPFIHSFVYSTGNFTEIGLGTKDTEASDINDIGQVVGMTQISPTSCRTCDDFAPHAFVYQNGVLTDLNDLLPAGSGWSLEWAYSINNNSTIVGQGTINGQTRAFALNFSGPVPTPTPTPIPLPTPTPPPAVCDLAEGMDVTTILSSEGWVMRNHSQPSGTTGWFQGNTGVFASQSGEANSYIGANFNNGAGLSTLNNWLLSPPITLQNGAMLTFYTRTVHNRAFPDRLQVRVSKNGSSANVGSTATDVGDFAMLLLDINPAYTLSGYPNVWTQFTVTISGIGRPRTGRIAFRYFVENGGPNGVNSDYIGIDTVAYTCTGTDLPPAATPIPNHLSDSISSHANPTYPLPDVALPLTGVTTSSAPNTSASRND